jgi:hypothetical protein
MCRPAPGRPTPSPRPSEATGPSTIAPTGCSTSSSERTRPDPEPGTDTPTWPPSTRSPSISSRPSTTTEASSSDETRPPETLSTGPSSSDRLVTRLQDRAVARNRLSLLHGPCIGSAASAKHQTEASRRGGRVVECTALEMRHGGNSIGGSNPSLSAIFPSQTLTAPPLRANFRVVSKGIGRTIRTAETDRRPECGL